MRPLEVLRALGPGAEPPPGAKLRVEGALFAALEAAALVSAAQVSKVPASPPPRASLFAGAAGSKLLAVAATIWLFGGVTGAAVYRALRPPGVRVVYVDRPGNGKATPGGESQPEPTVASSASLPIAASSVPSPLQAPSARSQPGAGRESSSELARERALLDLARTDAAHGEPARVLTVVRQHQARFPRGRLAEEREALAIRALLSLGRRQEAVARAQAFRVAYPSSFLIPVIEAALSIP